MPAFGEPREGAEISGPHFNDEPPYGYYHFLKPEKNSNVVGTNNFVGRKPRRLPTKKKKMEKYQELVVENEVGRPHANRLKSAQGVSLVDPCAKPQVNCFEKEIGYPNDNEKSRRCHQLALDEKE